MTRIVTTHYRYKRPPRKRKALALEVPAIVRAGKKAVSLMPTAANDDRKSAIVTARKSREKFGDAPDLTPDEHQRRWDAADALFRELVRRVREA
jgi:hypothetical protein